jgi:hypothetical protein
MEATGIYYESLAYHLSRLNLQVSVVLNNKVKHFSKSLNIKTKTDIVDARIIGKMGVERTLELWEPPDTIYKKLLSLTRLYTDLKKEKTTFTNRLDSCNSGESPLLFMGRDGQSLFLSGILYTDVKYSILRINSKTRGANYPGMKFIYHSIKSKSHQCRFYTHH